MNQELEILSYKIGKKDNRWRKPKVSIVSEELIIKKCLSYLSDFFNRWNIMGNKSKDAKVTDLQKYLSNKLSWPEVRSATEKEIQRNLKQMGK